MDDLTGMGIAGIELDDLEPPPGENYVGCPNGAYKQLKYHLSRITPLTHRLAIRTSSIVQDLMCKLSKSIFALRIPLQTVLFNWRP